MFARFVLGNCMARQTMDDALLKTMVRIKDSYWKNLSQSFQINSDDGKI